MKVSELKDRESMLIHIDVIQELYPKLTPEEYAENLNFMLNHNYTQIAVFDGEKCVGICGCWLAIKLWCGKYIELDNIVVRNEYRSKGVGQMIFDYANEKAKRENCNMMSLDSYTTNYKAHKFFYNNDYVPKGFHFVKILQKEKIRG